MRVLDLNMLSNLEEGEEVILVKNTRDGGVTRDVFHVCSDRKSISNGSLTMTIDDIRFYIWYYNFHLEVNVENSDKSKALKLASDSIRVDSLSTLDGVGGCSSNGCRVYCKGCDSYYDDM